MMGIQEFVSSVVLPIFAGGGAGWALIHFFGQRIVDHRLAKDLERYREELKEGTEVLKSQLSIYAHEQTVAISRVDTQRSNAIRNIYGCIRSVINPVSSISAGCPIQNGSSLQSAQFYLARAQEAQDAIGILSNGLADFAIYFDNSTYSKIVLFCKGAMEVISPYHDLLLSHFANGRSADDILVVAERERPLVRDRFETILKPRNTELVKIFREKLGIE